MKTSFVIQEASIDLDLVAHLERMVFGEDRATQEKLDKIRRQNGLLLVAYEAGQPVGFKLGYKLQGKAVFFSWLGGVHPEYRCRGIAQALLVKQEEHVRALGLSTIYFTTFDRFPEMIKLGLKNGYQLVRSEPEGTEVKYWYEKVLLPQD